MLSEVRIYDFVALDPSPHFSERVLSALGDMQDQLRKLVKTFADARLFKFKIVTYSNLRNLKDYLLKNEPWLPVSVVKRSRSLGYKGLVILCEREEFDYSVLFEECAHALLSFVNHPIHALELDYEDQLRAVLAHCGVASKEDIRSWLKEFSSTLEDSLAHYFIFSLMESSCEPCRLALERRLRNSANEALGKLSELGNGELALLHLVKIAPWIAVAQSFSDFKLEQRSTDFQDVNKLVGANALSKGDFDRAEGLRALRAEIAHLQLKALEGAGLANRFFKRRVA